MEPISSLKVKIIFAIVIALFIGFLIGRNKKTEIKNSVNTVKPEVKAERKPVEKAEKTPENKPSATTEENKE